MQQVGLRAAGHAGVYGSGDYDNAREKEVGGYGRNRNDGMTAAW